MKKLVFIGSMFFAIVAFSQNEYPQFSSQYFINDMHINPAVSGSKSYNPLVLYNRTQWLGFEGAPITSAISYHGALNNRSAMGGDLSVIKGYPFVQSTLSLNYAYHIPLNYDKVNLSFGLGSKMSYLNTDFNTGDLPIERDPAFSANSDEEIRFDALFGIYLYGSNFYSGFSIINLGNTSDASDAITGGEEKKTYFGIGAYRFNIMNNDWQFEPSFLIRKADKQAYNNDFTARIIYLNNTWASLGYRTNGTAVFGFGFAANNMHISYSYDHTFSGEIMQYNYGTHELGISFRIETMATQRHIGFWGY